MLISLKYRTTFAFRNFPNRKMHSSINRSIYDICVFLVTKTKTNKQK